MDKENEVCIDKSIDHNGNSAPFIWTEEKINAYGKYRVEIIRNKSGWCECLSCFKRRFANAEKFINRDNCTNESHYIDIVVNSMEF